MAGKTWIDKASDQIAKFTPKSGYNVVAVDQSERPGEALYLVGHEEDKAAAERLRAAHQKKSGNTTYVYVATSEAD